MWFIAGIIVGALGTVHFSEKVQDNSTRALIARTFVMQNEEIMTQVMIQVLANLYINGELVNYYQSGVESPRVREIVQNTIHDFFQNSTNLNNIAMLNSATIVP